MLIDFRQLWPKYNINPKGVVHIGGNRGEEYSVYMELGVTKQMWFEPNPEVYKQLVQNIQPNHERCAYNIALGDRNEKVTLHIANNGGQSSSVLELGTHRQAHPEVEFIKDITVQMKRLDSVFGSLFGEYDFLNIDVQGAELKVLKGMGILLHDFKWLYLEVNKEELYVGCALVDEIDEYVSKFGFVRQETLWCGNTGWGDALFIRKDFLPKIG